MRTVQMMRPLSTGQSSDDWSKKVNLFAEHWYIFNSGKIFPLALLTTVFRISSFAFITTALGYYSIPLYMFLILGPITIDYVYNTTKDRFVVRGMTSVLSIGELTSMCVWPLYICYFSFSGRMLPLWGSLPSLLVCGQLQHHSSLDNLDRDNETSWFWQR